MAPVAAIFAALPTKVGVYSIIRVFTLVFPAGGYIGAVIGTIAALTMVTGVLGAASHYDVRRILSFHIISQIGLAVPLIALYEVSILTASWMARNDRKGGDQDDKKG